MLDVSLLSTPPFFVTPPSPLDSSLEVSRDVFLGILRLAWRVREPRTFPSLPPADLALGGSVGEAAAAAGEEEEAEGVSV